MKKTMKNNVKNNVCNHNGCNHHVCGAGPNGAIYGLGFIGAAVYYISTSTTFWMGVLGFLKALVWPAFLVYELLKLLVA